MAEVVQADWRRPGAERDLLEPGRDRRRVQRRAILAGERVAIAGWDGPAEVKAAALKLLASSPVPQARNRTGADGAGRWLPLYQPSCFTVTDQLHSESTAR